MTIGRRTVSVLKEDMMNKREPAAEQQADGQRQQHQHRQLADEHAAHFAPG